MLTARNFSLAKIYAKNCSAFLQKFLWITWITYVIRFAKTRHNDVFLEIQIVASMSSIYLKLCSVATPMLYCKSFRVTRLDRKRSSTLALYAFLRRLIFHVFDYRIITYRYSNIRSWDKDFWTQYEMTILIIYRFLRKYKD